jgi:hypothetical protein
MTSLHSDLVQNNLHEAFHYVQTSDPGAVGAGKYWLDTTSSPYILKRRNPGDSAWVTIGASAVAGNVSWINVTDYGALADDATNNTTAINDAIAAVIAQGGGTLYFPWTVDGGKYRHTSNLDPLETEAARTSIRVLFDIGVQLRPSADVLSFNLKQDDSQVFDDVSTTVVFENVWVDPVTPGQATGCRIRDSFGVQFKSSFFTNLKKGVLIESYNSWSEGTQMKGVIIDGCTTGLEFLKTTGQTPAATGSNQSSQIEAWIRTASGGTGVKVGAGCQVYSSEFNLQVWPVGNNSIGIDMQGDGTHSIWHGNVDLAGFTPTPVYALQIGSGATGLDDWQFDMDFRGTYNGGEEESGAVKNASTVSWTHSTMPYGSGGGGGFTSARVFRSTNQTGITSGDTYPAVSFDEDSGDGAFDEGGYWSGGAPTRLTIPDNGTYMFGGNVVWDGNTTGRRDTKIRLNGDNSALLASVGQSVVGANTVQNLSSIKQFAAGDYIELIVFQDSGSNRDLLTSDTDAPVFWITRVK